MTAAALVTLFRAVPPGLWLVRTGRKPWACDLCMSFWATVLETLVLAALVLLSLIKAIFLLAVIPGFIICLWFVKQTKEFEFPENEEEK
jgi:cytochrome bd-type quinol oxidase subunit 1